MIYIITFAKTLLRLLSKIFIKFDKNIYIILKNADQNTFSGYTNQRYQDTDRFLIFYSNNCYYRSFPNFSPTSVNLLDTVSRKSITLFESKIWNWQQGTNAFFDKSGHIISNCSNENGQLCVINYDFQNNIRSTLSTGSCLLAYSRSASAYVLANPERINYLRKDYGFFNYNNNSSVKFTNDDIAFNLIYNNQSVSISYRNILSLFRCNHFVLSKCIHFHFNDMGNKLYFIFRTFANGSKRQCNLVEYCLITNTLKLLIKNQFISHYEIVSNKLYFYGSINKTKGIYVIMDKIVKLVRKTNTDYHFCIADSNFVLDSYPNRFSVSSVEINDNDFNIKKKFIFIGNSIFRGPVRVDHHVKYHPYSNNLFLDIDLGDSRKVCNLKYEM